MLAIVFIVLVVLFALKAKRQRDGEDEEENIDDGFVDAPEVEIESEKSAKESEEKSA